MSIEFQGSVAVVTGAGSGIGRSIAHSLAARGTRIVVSDIEDGFAQNVVKEIKDAGATAIAVAADVTDQHSVQALAERTLEEYGRIDILCNNAGATLRPFRATWDGDISDFRWMMDVNYFGVVNGVLAFLPHMLGTQTRKHIVNTSSMASLDEIVGHTMYTAAKSAVNALSEVLRAELADREENIGLTVLMPGQVATRISTSERLRPDAERSTTRNVPAYERRTPMKRPPISPDDVGPLVVAAIEADAPYCLTHGAPVDRMRERLEQIVDGYRFASVPEVTR